MPNSEALSIREERIRVLASGGEGDLKCERSSRATRQSEARQADAGYRSACLIRSSEDELDGGEMSARSECSLDLTAGPPAASVRPYSGKRRGWIRERSSRACDPGFPSSLAKPESTRREADGACL